jgi:aspartate racemase
MNMIGIVGGVGPYAGLDLTSKIFSQTIARSDQEHLPVALLSLPSRIEDRTRYLLGETKDNPARPVSEIILQLEGLGATVVGIPCNTMHAPEIFGVIRENLFARSSRITLVNMIEEVVKFIRQHYPGFERVGVLSTTGTWRKGIYTRALEENDLEPLVLPEKMQEQVHDAIFNEDYGIKAQSNPVTLKAKNKLTRGLRQLKEQGAQGVILGCTEIPYALPYGKLDDLCLFDATWILARSLVANSYPSKLKPVEDGYPYS